MKKFLAVAVVALASITASAQYYVGGSFGIGYDSSAKKTQFTLVPEIGYSFSDNMAFGGTIGYTYNGSVKNSNGDDVSIENYVQINPYLRYTFCRVADDKLSFFFDSTVGIGLGFQGGQTGVTYSIGFKPGIAYSLSDHCSLVAHMGFLGWEGASDKAKMLGFNDKFSLDFSSMNVSFGFYYSF